MKIFYFSDESFLDMKNHFESSFKEDLEKQFTYLENINIDRTKPGSGKDIWKFKQKWWSMPSKQTKVMSF